MALCVEEITKDAVYNIQLLMSLKQCGVSYEIKLGALSIVLQFTCGFKLSMSLYLS